jgi:hypothetical protein
MDGDLRPHQDFRMEQRGADQELLPSMLILRHCAAGADVHVPGGRTCCAAGVPDQCCRTGGMGGGHEILDTFMMQLDN